VPALFIGLICTFLLVASPVSAASIVVQQRGSNEPSFVSIQGTFVLNDDEVLRGKTAGLTQAIVSFESNGGNLLAGIRIGTLIRQKGFSTVVDSGAVCASACALAWLGGKTRSIGDGARVGFHAAARTADGLRIESAMGNALVAAYLSQLGFRPEAIAYVTKSGPASMTWLTFADAQRLGFEVMRLTSSPVRSRDHVKLAADSQRQLTVRSRTAAYSIEYDLDGSPICITKDGQKLFCPAVSKARLGNLVRTRDYDVLPVFTACRGPGCQNTGTVLIIERSGETTVNGSLAEYCLECSEEAAQVNRDGNHVRFVLSGKSDEQIVARVQNGVVLIEPLRASSQKPLDQAQCTFVYAQLGDCARAPFCSMPNEGMPPASRARLQKIMDEHPWFPGEGYLRQCAAACQNKSNMDRSLFSGLFCRW